MAQLDPFVAGPVRGRRLLRSIALFKFGKAILLTCVALGAWELVNPAFAARAKRWSSFATTYDLDVARRLVAAAADLTPHRLEALGALALGYAVLFTIEGIGLWRYRRWAEYITVISTCTLVPFEVFEIWKRTTPERISALAINLVVVGYLIHRLRQRAGEGPNG